MAKGGIQLVCGPFELRLRYKKKIRETAEVSSSAVS